MLVISKNNENDIIVAKITSVIKDGFFNYSIKPNTISFTIHKKSQIITNAISTISKKIIIKKIGRLYDEELDIILEKIKQNISRY